MLHLRAWQRLLQIQVANAADPRFGVSSSAKDLETAHRGRNKNRDGMSQPGDTNSAGNGITNTELMGLEKASETFESNHDLKSWAGIR